MTEQAALAIHAARNYRRWGRYATVQYCLKRGVPRRLLTIAIQLASV